MNTSIASSYNHRQLDSQFGSLSLEGCGVPATAHAIATLVRRESYLTLRPLMTQDLLVAAIRMHPGAAWWIEHQYDATLQLARELARTCAL